MNIFFRGLLVGFFGAITFIYFLMFVGIALGVENLTLNLWILIIENKFFIWLCATSSIILHLFYGIDFKSKKKKEIKKE